ncbi:mitochondrial Lysine_Motif (LysM) domain-containing protein [Andalucia godoyi]|uniref:Mitochondrial Lysine_Motif (LysM) domain-containing protein n=1 Tax=Andalucia godoyi TaxID=505711 RepID=A0A8K0AIX6_ANDGO|nr:mitochondrial Lysine_Motif (LysM) domain-containing protein [Andalucia godoyi]|eukprot:ANDGO_04256.mRNA.1 mitochondrial Lysine_Motif (LysM) domain-containing protein
MSGIAVSRAAIHPPRFPRIILVRNPDGSLVSASYERRAVLASRSEAASMVMMMEREEGPPLQQPRRMARPDDGVDGLSDEFVSDEEWQDDGVGGDELLEEDSIDPRELVEWAQRIQSVEWTAPSESFEIDYLDHRVCSSDTLAGIALRYGVTTFAIQRANGIASSSHFISHRTWLRVPKPLTSNIPRAVLELLRRPPTETTIAEMLERTDPTSPRLQSRRAGSGVPRGIGRANAADVFRHHREDPVLSIQRRFRVCVARLSECMRIPREEASFYLMEAEGDFALAARLCQEDLEWAREHGQRVADAITARSRPPSFSSRTSNANSPPRAAPRLSGGLFQRRRTTTAAVAADTEIQNMSNLDANVGGGHQEESRFVSR